VRIALTHAFCQPEVRRGAERFVPELGAALVRRGHDVTHFSAAWCSGRATERGVRIVRMRRIFRNDFRHEADFAQANFSYAVHVPAIAHGPCRDLAVRSREAVAARLRGQSPKKAFGFRYLHQCISLGRQDAVIQFVGKLDESPRRMILTGRAAMWYKDIVLKSGMWSFEHPGPILPRRRARAHAAATHMERTANA
jgi:hypothetical protein